VAEDGYLIVFHTVLASNFLTLVSNLLVFIAGHRLRRAEG
jgi:hypothetical protein